MKFDLKRRDLVYTHQTAVADDIGGKDCTSYAPAIPETAHELQVHQCAQQRPRDTATTERSVPGRRHKTKLI
jgi:hypothetical protein